MSSVPRACAITPCLQIGWNWHRAAHTPPARAKLTGPACQPIWPYSRISTADGARPHTAVSRPPVDGSAAGEAQIQSGGATPPQCRAEARPGGRSGHTSSQSGRRNDPRLPRVVAPAPGGGCASAWAPGSRHPLPAESGDFRGARVARQRQSPARGRLSAAPVGRVQKGEARADLPTGVSRRTSLVPQTCSSPPRRRQRCSTPSCRPGHSLLPAQPHSPLCSFLNDTSSPPPPRTPLSPPPNDPSSPRARPHFHSAVAAVPAVV